MTGAPLMTPLSYTKDYHTANGVISGAPVILGTMVVGPITLQNISASVNKADMGTSLLGMAFFRQLRGFSVDGDVLTLKP
jgi:aspartyl protease family protein